ncbi:AbrB/MazE/SpoVT family DNA-binding domain-containing protein [Methanobacterium oryzae]|uniref:AbrB/MazE/SpoVT family DNA-binding domain-containing protein n=1 Tax=Methanobacterium oryzae TaxID=69540 RepID=UPI003D204B93
MVNVTKKYQVTIPRYVREDLHIHQGDKVVFVKNSDGNWVIMTTEYLTRKMIESSRDIQKSNEELEPIKG